MKLYEITSNMLALWDEIEAAMTGAQDQTELDSALKHYETKLKELDGTHTNKCLDIACLIKSVEAEAEAIKAEKDKLAARQSAAEKKAEWLRSYLSDSMEPGTNLKDARAIIGWRKSEGVDVTVAAAVLPPEYVRTKTTIDADKTKIKDALKAGPVPELYGKASLTTRFNIQIK